MEIDKAIKDSGNRRLQTKYNNAVYVIQRTFALYEFEQIAFSFNGGKDSTVLLHLIRAGYYLYKEKSNGSCLGSNSKCPIRTIYFESPSTFPEINSFTYETAANYELQLETIHSDFKSGLEALLKEKPIKAIFMGTRIGDPNAVGQEQFSPSSIGWPPFMRVNPILDWSYRDVWAFILTCKVKYCSLYDKGYTSIGSIYDTQPNSLLSVADTSGSKENFKPAYMLSDGRLERAGRARKISLNSQTTPICGNGLKTVVQNGTLTASVIVVGDEILFGIAQENMGPILCKKLHAIGWQVTHVAIPRNDIDSVAEEVELQKSVNDMVFLLGGFGSLHSDVSLAGVAKAFGVRLAPDEEFEEYLRHLTGDHCTGYENKMALLPEGITELLQHEKLPLPLVKCRNVIILSAANASELETQWECLLELPCTPLLQLTPFTLRQLSTKLSDVETALEISKICLEYPDVYIGCHRTSRTGPLIVNFVGKDKTRTEAAAARLCNCFSAGAFLEVTSG